MVLYSSISIQARLVHLLQLPPVQPPLRRPHLRRRLFLLDRLPHWLSKHGAEKCIPALDVVKRAMPGEIKALHQMDKRVESPLEKTRQILKEYWKRLKMSWQTNPGKHPHITNTLIFQTCPKFHTDQQRRSSSQLQRDSGQELKSVSNGSLYEVCGHGM